MPGRYTRAGLALVLVPFYAGPVLAGWVGAPWAAMPVFAALFLLYMVRTRGLRLGNGAELASLALVALVQVALVSLLMLAGRGLAAAAGTPPLPAWAVTLLPLALTGLAAAIGARRYRHAPALTRALDKALAAIDSQPGSFGPPDLDREIARLTEQYASDGTHPPQEIGLFARLDAVETCGADGFDPDRLVHDLIAHPARAAMKRQVLRRTDWDSAFLELALQVFSDDRMPADALSQAEIEALIDEALEVTSSNAIRYAGRLAARTPQAIPAEMREQLELEARILGVRDDV